MVIGHIKLAPGFDRHARQLLRLTSALAELGVQQHALVASNVLARELEARAAMPVVRVAPSAVEACCDLEACDLVHAHDLEAGKAALLLRLTSSQHYILSHHPSNEVGADAVLDSLTRRADCVVCTSEAAAAALRRDCAAAEVRIVRDGWQRPASRQLPGHDTGAGREMLRVYRWALQSGADCTLAR